MKVVRIMLMLLIILHHQSQAFPPCIRRQRTTRLATTWYGDEDRPLKKSPPRKRKSLATRNRSNPRGAGGRPRYARPQRRQHSVAYREALRILSTCRSSEEISNWLQTIDRGLAFDNREYPDFVKELASRKAYDAMLIFLREHSNQSVFVYTSVISALANSKQARYRKMAMKLLPEMKVEPTTFTFTALFNSIDGAKASLNLLERIRRDYSQVTVGVEIYNAAIHACSRGDDARSNDWQTALKLFLEMKKEGILPNQPTFGSLLHSCAQAGQVRVAMSLLDEMKTTIVRPNAKVWGAALNSCAQVGEYQEAMKILKDMQEMGISPSTWHLSAVLTALAKAGQHEMALQMLEGMQSNTPVLFPLRSGESLVLPPVPLDLVAINTVIYACAKVGNYAVAKELLEQLKAGEFTAIEEGSDEAVVLRPDEFSYNAVLSACRKPKEARALVREMRNSRRHRHGAIPPTRITYTHAITACRKAELPDLETALAFLEMARDDGIEPNVFMYSAAIWTAETCGEAEVALHILKEMKEVGCQPNIISYLGVLSALSFSGFAEEAVQLFQEMKDSGVIPDEKVFLKLGMAIKNAPENINKLPLLESVVELMNAHEMRARVGGPIMENLIISYGLNNRFEDALRVFEMISGPTDGPCLRAMLSACSVASVPRWEKALEILHTSDIVEGARGPARIDPRAIGFATIACAKGDQWEEGLNLLKLYGQPLVYERSNGMDANATVPVSALNSLISSCGRNGRPDVALRLLNEMESLCGIQPDEISFRSAAIACNQAEHEKRRRQDLGLEPRYKFDDDGSPQWWECALSLLRRMKESDLQPDPQTYSSVISACEAAGEWQRALGVLRDMMASSAGDFSRLNLFCFNAAIAACEKGGAWVEGLELYHRILEERGAVKPNFITLNSILIALENAGQKEMALEMYKEAVQRRVVKPWKRTKGVDGGKIRAIDLHQNSAAMATVAIRYVMESLLEDLKPVHDIQQDLVIIVGKGRGSDNSESVLRPAVEDLLEQDYCVSAKVDEKNTGRLIVRAEALESFVDKRQWRE